jgi:hypothetical protein
MRAQDGIDPAPDAAGGIPSREASGSVAVVAAALLGAWCVAGAASSASSFLDAAQSVRNARSEGVAVVGIPLLGAPYVAVLRHVLASVERTGDAPWLVMIPNTTPLVVAEYIRAQLAYADYPLRVDVAPLERVRHDASYEGIVVVPGVKYPWAGEVVQVIEGYRVYRGPQP